MSGVQTPRKRRYTEKDRARGAAWRARNPERTREYFLQLKFGMSMEDYTALLEAQDGRCAVCGSTPDTRALAVDHDHTCCPGDRACGACNRGLLCDSCNLTFGTIERRGGAAWLRSALAYLEAHRG